MTDPFEREVEDWIDRLEREFVEVEPETPSATGDVGAVAGRGGRRSGRPLRPAREVREPHVIRPTADSHGSSVEQRLTEQVALLTSARRELARTATLIELMKEVSVEIRTLRDEVAAARESSSEIQSLRREMDQVRIILARLRELAQARKKSSS